MKVLFLISSLDMGGAQRVLVNLANGLNGRAHQVSILTLGQFQESVFPVSSEIPVSGLELTGASDSLMRGILQNRKRSSAIREAAQSRSPDVLISFGTRMNVLSLVAARYPSDLDCAVIVAEHTDPLMSKKSKVWTLLRKRLYPKSDCVVGCGEGVAKNLASLGLGKRIVAIPNPVTIDDRPPDLNAEKLAAEITASGLKWVVSVGRIYPPKAFDRLVRAYSKVSDRLAGWGLVIVGDGPQKQELEQLTGELEIRDRVRLPGALPDPTRILRACDLFVLSSRFEGFPVSLAEALACGLPAVAFRCHSGPEEIIRDGVDGILVPPDDEVALTEAMFRVMNEDQLRSRLAGSAIEGVERFSLSRTLDRWEELLLEVTQGS